MLLVFLVTIALCSAQQICPGEPSTVLQVGDENTTVFQVDTAANNESVRVLVGDFLVRERNIVAELDASATLLALLLNATATLQAQYSALQNAYDELRAQQLCYGTGQGFNLRQNGVVIGSLDHLVLIRANCPVIYGDLIISQHFGGSSVLDLSGITNITGGFRVDNTLLTKISAPHLVALGSEYLTGQFVKPNVEALYLHSNILLTNVSMPSLVLVRGSIYLVDNNVLAALDLSSVQTFMNSLTYSGSGPLSSFSLPALTTRLNNDYDRCIFFASAPLLQTISFPLLSTTCQYSITSGASLTTVNLGSLISTTGSTVSANAALNCPAQGLSYTSITSTNNAVNCV